MDIGPRRWKDLGHKPRNGGILKKGAGRRELRPLPLHRKSRPEGLVIQYNPHDLLRPYSNPNLGALSALQLPQRAISRRRGHHSLLRRMQAKGGGRGGVGGRCGEVFRLLKR